jgi:hypothetical protein
MDLSSLDEITSNTNVILFNDQYIFSTMFVVVIVFIVEWGDWVYY